MGKEKKSHIKKKRSDGLLRQSQIIKTALELFAEKGFIQTSVNDIISACGIARGTFYIHFSGKDDLLDMIFDKYLKTLYESLKVLDISMPGPVKEIKKLYLDVAQFLIDQTEVRQFVTLILREISGLNNAFSNKVNTFTTGMIIMSAEYIKEAQKQGAVIKEIEPVTTAYCIIGSIKEILYRWIVLEEDINLKKTIAATVDLFFRGMLSHPPEK